MCRAKTADELRDEILDYMHAMVNYWADLPGEKSTRERIDGAMFSILVMLDGCADLNAFDLVARSHPDDKQYCIDNGEDWVEDGTTISTMLHEYWHKKAQPEPKGK